jgi:hypothetical protein
VALVLTQLHKAAWLYSGGSTMHTLAAHQRLGREGGRASSLAAADLAASPRYQAPRTPTHGPGPGPDSPKITYQRWQVGVGCGVWRGVGGGMGVCGCGGSIGGGSAA